MQHDNDPTPSWGTDLQNRVLNRREQGCIFGSDYLQAMSVCHLFCPLRAHAWGKNALTAPVTRCWWLANLVQGFEGFGVVTRDSSPLTRPCPNDYSTILQLQPRIPSS